MEIHRREDLARLERRLEYDGAARKNKKERE